MSRKYLAFGAATFALSLASCSGPQQEPVHAEEQPRAVPVTAGKLRRDEIARRITVAGEFRPYEEVELHAKVAGYLHEIFVDAGDRVQKGQVLATLEVPEMAQDIAQATAARARSEAEVVRARVELQRTQTTATMMKLSYDRLAAVLKSRPNLVAEQEIDEAKARAKSSEEQVAASRAALAAAEEGVRVATASETRAKTLESYTRLTAPFAGVITKRYAHPGAMIQAGTASQSQAMPVVRLSNDERLRLVAPLPENAIAAIGPGARVSVTVPTLHRTIHGAIARSTSRVQSSTRTMEVEIDIPNHDHALKPGMFADVELMLDRKPNALVVPPQAIVNAATQPALYVVTADRRVKPVPVRLGIESAKATEVMGDIKEGDVIVIAGQNRLREGQSVTAQMEPEAGK